MAFKFVLHVSNAYCFLFQAETPPSFSPCNHICFSFLVSCSLPGATMLGLCAGFLFKQPWSTIYAVIGAATGAVIIFYVARTSFGEHLRTRVRSTSGKSASTSLLSLSFISTHTHTHTHIHMHVYTHMYTHKQSCQQRASS